MSYLKNNNFVKAVKFIYLNLDQPLLLEDVAKATHLSLSSLKRLFLEATGVSVGTFIRRLRMERAFRSLKNQDFAILEIALQSGFEDHSAFARSFKDNFGYSPTVARTKFNIIDELEFISLEEPEIVELDNITIQMVTKQGLYFEAAPLAWQSLKEHLSSAELNDDFVGTFIGIGHDNPHDGEIPEHKVRFSAGVAFSPQDLKIECHTIPGGTYARFKYKGKIHNLGLAYHYIYGKWSTQYGLNINHAIPAFIAFSRFPDDAFQEETLALYVPCIKE